MAKETKSFLEVLNSKWITPALAIVTGVYGFLFYQTNQKLNEQKLQLQNQEAQAKIPLIQKGFDNTLKLEIFKEVKEITSKESNINQQKMVNLIVTEMLADYPGYRDNLLDVINGSSLIDTNVKKSIDTLRKNEILFAKSQEDITVAPTDNRIKIDVFYLDEIKKEAEPRADMIVKLINENFSQKYVAKKILFPASINSQSIYKIEANQVRCERDKADDVKEILTLINNKNVFQKEQLFLRVIRDEPLKNISIFVRNM